jgi:hypothetical protein
MELSCGLFGATDFSRNVAPLSRAFIDLSTSLPDKQMGEEGDQGL